MNSLAGLTFVKQIKEMVVAGADAKKAVEVVYAKALGQGKGLKGTFKSRSPGYLVVYVCSLDITDLQCKIVHVVFPPGD